MAESATSKQDAKANSDSNARKKSAQSIPTPDPQMDLAAKTELGRLALEYVGDDEDANTVWIVLINDPTLPANVRQDLIEDLNETGFSEDEGRTATVDDIPLIESRIALIEEHAPRAMDETNVAAFAEAYKDLVNMLTRLSREQAQRLPIPQLQ